MNLLPAEERYLRDPTFARVVDTLESAIEALHLTPTEVREAAMLAAIRFEMKRPKALYFEDGKRDRP